jgi:tetratricopeptide (TPR) repeat protein
MARTPLIAAAIALFALSTAHAEPPEDAKDHFIKGRRAYDLGMYDKAIAEYQLAYNLKPDPALLFNIAQCHRLANHLELAVVFYQNYLDLVPTSPKRPEIVEAIVQLKREIRANRPLEQKEKFDSLPPRLDDFPDPPHPGGRMMTLGATLLACGLVAGAGAGIAFGLAAADKAAEITYASEHHVPFDPATESAGRSLQLGSILGYALGGAVAVVGVVLIAVGARTKPEPAATAFAPLRWSF